MQDPKEVIAALEQIAALLRFLGESKFKIEAYERGAEIVRTVDGELPSLIERDGLRDLQGIGDALSRQIQELWNTGTSPLLERLRSEAPPGAAELMRAPGLTPRRIRLLSEALGVDSIEALRTACLEQRVRRVPGFGAKTEQKLLEACDALEPSSGRTPPPTLLARGLALSALLGEKLSMAGLTWSVAGGLRRGEETLTELDLAVAGELEAALHELSRLRQVLRIERAAATARLFLSEGVVVVLHAGGPARWGNLLLATTGTPEHVAALRERAQKRGFSLDETSFDGEAALYGALGLPLVPPELRYGRAELELAEQQGFAGLLELRDIRGLVHCHTTYSDGRESVLEMARAAHAQGMQYITITDHSPSAYYARGVALDRLKAQWDEIAAAEAVVPIRIFRGTESDILRDGSLDYPDAVLEQLDVVIASIHARHRLSREDMTRRLEQALSLPLFKIWGHGLGRILNHRDPIDCDVPAVLDALARGGGAVELNADPYRLDLPPAWIPHARERGIPFVVSVDAHSSNGFRVLPLGVTMAKRGALTANEVLNTLSPAEFAQRVRPKR
jgi:DNA polymerase (family X)